MKLNIEVPRVRFVGINHCVINVNGVGSFLQSYATVVVACLDSGMTYLDPKWCYSRTTTRHVAAFLGLAPEEIIHRVKDGVLHVEDLNS
jgi:hypothetical protein